MREDLLKDIGWEQPEAVNKDKAARGGRLTEAIKQVGRQAYVAPSEESIATV